jgi:tyrosine-protein phosphatase YwqE
MVQTSVDELIRGAIDLHLHTAPDIYLRSLDDIEMAIQAKKSGLAAVIMKNHITSTADRAQIARKITDFPVFGGIALNYGVGGLNPVAVENAIKLGAVEVWMPTIDAAHFLKNPNAVPMLAKEIKSSSSGISLIDKVGNLVDELQPILELIAKHKIILATGHVAPEESLALIKEAVEIGIKKIVITHPEASFINFTEDALKEGVQMGALVEHVYASCTSVLGEIISPKKIAAMIQSIGVENTIMASDGGQSGNPPPVEMFKLFMEKMLENGISEDEIHVMTHENPAKLLNL